MQGARNGPRMDEDPVGPPHWVACGPVGYKHGMRDGMRGRDHEKSVARAAQQPLENGKPRDAGIGPVTGGGKGEGDIAEMRTNQSRERRQKAPSNNPVGLRNQSPWSGEPWANHGEPDHGKSGKYPELRDGREVSARLRVDPEVPGSMG